MLSETWLRRIFTVLLFVASVALFITMLGFASWLNEYHWGRPVFFVGLVMLVSVQLSKRLTMGRVPGSARTSRCRGGCGTTSTCASC